MLSKFSISCFHNSMFGCNHVSVLEGANEISPQKFNVDTPKIAISWKQSHLFQAPSCLGFHWYPPSFKVYKCQHGAGIHDTWTILKHTELFSAKGNSASPNGFGKYMYGCGFLPGFQWPPRWHRMFSFSKGFRVKPSFATAMLAKKPRPKTLVIVGSCRNLT